LINSIISFDKIVKIVETNIFVSLSGKQIFFLSDL